MLRSFAGALILGTAALASACGASRPQAQDGEHGSQRAYREMTWREYYCDVERRTRRAGGMVMWLNPPRPERRTANEPARAPDPECTGTLLIQSGAAAAR